MLPKHVTRVRVPVSALRFFALLRPQLPSDAHWGVGSLRPYKHRLVVQAVACSHRDYDCKNGCSKKSVIAPSRQVEQSLPFE